ncbi:hypothetical protein MAKP2_29560, partial [Klebsiella pneumoniae subsp. pneumoniae]
LLLLLLLLQPF